MAEEQPKTIKISVSLDDAAFAKAKAAIRELTNDVSKLVQEMGKINAHGGGGGGVSFTNKTQMPGQAQPSMQQQQQIKATGAAAPFVQSIVAQKDLFKTIASSSKEAMKAMNDALKDSVRDQTSHINKLKQEIEGLSKTYRSLRANNTGGLGDLIAPGAAKETLATMTGKGKDLATAEKELRAMMGAGGGAPTGWRGSLPGFMNVALPGSGLLGRAASAVGLGGLGLGAAGLGAGIGAAAIGTYNYATDKILNNRQANMADRLEKPMDMSRLQATMGNIFGGMGMSVIGGDAARAAAFMRVMGRGGPGRMVIGGNTRMAEEDLIAMGQGRGESMARLGNIARRAGEKYGEFATDEHLGVGNLSPSEIAIRRQKTMMPAEQAKRIQELVNNELIRDPYTSSLINEAYAGSLGRTGAQRALRMGRHRKVTQTRVGEGVYQIDRTFADAAAEASAQAIERGYDPGQRASMVGALSGAAFNFRRGGLSEMSVLSAQTGGFNNAPGVLSQIAGYTDPTRFMGAVGRSGIDPTAASNIAGMVANMVSKTGGGFDPTFAMQGMFSAARGGNPFQQVMNSQWMGQGLGLMGGQLGGQMSGLSMATTELSAIGAAGNNFPLREALKEINPIEMMSIIRNKGGNMPDSITGKGGSYQTVKDYFDKQQMYQFSETIRTGGEDTPYGRAIAGAVAAGGQNAYLRQFKDPKQLAQQMRYLGMGMKSQFGGDMSAAIGAVMDYAATDTELSPIVKGRGFADYVSKDSPEGVANKAKADEARRKEFDTDKMADDLKTIFPSMSEAGRKMIKLGSDFTQSAEKFELALEALTSAIENRLGRLDLTAGNKLADQLRKLHQQAAGNETTAAKSESKRSSFRQRGE